MIYYSEDTLNDLFKNETFLDDYNFFIEDNEKIEKMEKSLNSIELNKKYFRLTMNKNTGYKKKYKNKNLGDDTIAIKEINSLLNKCSDKNIQKISVKMQDKLVDKNYLSQLIIDSIIDKSLINTIYIKIYLELIQTVFKNTKNLNDIINLSIKSAYEKMNEVIIDESQSDYLQFCDKNKKLDKLIGYSLLIAECEKMNIIKDQIHPLLDKLINILSETKDNDEKYKCSQCLYNIFKSLYNESELPPVYFEKINKMKNDETFMKIKFKYMDIIDRK